MIIVGVKMTMWYDDGKAPRFYEKTYFIHIVSSQEAIGRTFPVDLPIVAHPGRTVAAIARVLKSDAVGKLKSPKR